MRSTRRIQILQHFFFAIFACFCSNSFLNPDFFISRLVVKSFFA
jgi:hypothetical protein